MTESTAYLVAACVVMIVSLALAFPLIPGIFDGRYSAVVGVGTVFYLIFSGLYLHSREIRKDC